MRTRSLIETAAREVIDYRCASGPHDPAFTEHHQRHSISYVRKGNFGCRTLGGSFDLVAGSVMIGYPGLRKQAVTRPRI